MKKPSILLLLLVTLPPPTPASSPRFYASFPLPSAHPLYPRHAVKPPPLSVFSPGNCTSQLFCPGFAAIRGFDMAAPQTWEPTLDLYTRTLDVANMVWPSYADALSPLWPQLATLLANRSVPATDLGGFVPGGVQEFDVSSAPAYGQGREILGNLFLGFDMGEQDVRYLWGYAKNVLLPGPKQRMEQLVRFRDFSWAIESRSNATMAALASSVYGVHHWLKTGFYTLAGAETSQSNGNAQVLYAFVRGAAKQYAALYYGQVSIFDWFGYKIPGDPNPSPQCASQSDHSPTCGTSLSLMRRLLYTQLAYNGVYFAFEGELAYDSNTSQITPIGTIQQSAKRFFTEQSSASPGGLGIHTPTIALLLDFVGGWTRPCDTAPFSYLPAAWGNVPWDGADYFADAVVDTVWPGYRAGALMRNETGYLSPTPFGDAADVLLSDAIPSVLERYDTVVLAHRAESDAADLLFRLQAYLTAGGNVVATASTLADMQAAAAAVPAPSPSAPTALGGVAVGACASNPAGTTITLANGTQISEPLAFLSCSLSPVAGWEVLAALGAGTGGQPFAVRVAVGNGSLTVLGAGNYGIATEQGSGPYFSCTVDEVDTRENQPYQMITSVRLLLEQALKSAAAFDLGDQLAWVPQRVGSAEYVLTVTNPSLQQASLQITSLLGEIAQVVELQLDTSAASDVGYLPHGFAGADIGKSTNTTIAGGDTRVFRVTLVSDNSSLIPSGGNGPLPPNPSPSPSSLFPNRRMLRLQPGTGDLRRQILARPAFDSTFGGLMIDWEYLWSREASALAEEGKWLALNGVSRIAVDLSSATNLFPGLRLCDDMGMYYQQSLATIRSVLAKMPSLGATDLLVTLHGVSELPPANFSSDPVGSTRASSLSTLQQLVGEAAAVNVTLHLRRTARNAVLAGPTLKEQASFASSAGMMIAPNIAYITAQSDVVSEIQTLLTGGQASLLLLSSAWTSVGGRFVEGGPLTQLPSSQLPSLQALHAAAMAAEGVYVVMDAGYDSGEAGGRAQELADAGFLQGLVS